MPNLCHNRLTVTGPAPDLDRFLQTARGTDVTGQEQPFSLRSLFPIPAHLDTGKPVQNLLTESWYTWCVANWGTKWDVQVTSYVRRSATECEVTFRSAWSAPAAAFTLRIAPAFPLLTFILATEDEDRSSTTEYRWHVERK